MEGDAMINVVFITDNKYAAITGTAITSLKANRNKQNEYHIYVIIIDMDGDNSVKLKGLSEEGFQITLIADDAKFAKYNRRKDNFTSKSTYTRFYLDELLPELDKVIYLDDDIIVQQDLAELNSVLLEDYYCAAVRDMVAETSTPSHMEKLRCNLKYYFNAGVMLLNLKKMREDKTSEKLIDYIQNGLNYLGNQDAFNIVFNGNVRYISCLWNFHVMYLKKMSSAKIAEYYNIPDIKDEYDFIKESKIVHFAATPKPWDMYQYGLTDLFMHYYRKSPWGELECFNSYKFSIAEIQYLFPFEMIEKGSTIILYGAGRVGRVFIGQIETSGYCKVAAWVDTLESSIGTVTVHGKSYVIDNPQILLDKEKNIDYIVVAVKQETIYEDIMKKLIDMGISKEKVIWRYPGYYVD